MAASASTFTLAMAETNTTSAPKLYSYGAVFTLFYEAMRITDGFEFADFEEKLLDLIDLCNDLIEAKFLIDSIPLFLVLLGNYTERLGENPAWFNDIAIQTRLINNFRNLIQYEDTRYEKYKNLVNHVYTKSSKKKFEEIISDSFHPADDWSELKPALMDLQTEYHFSNQLIFSGILEFSEDYFFGNMDLATKLSFFTYATSVKTSDADMQTLISHYIFHHPLPPDIKNFNISKDLLLDYLVHNQPIALYSALTEIVLKFGYGENFKHFFITLMEYIYNIHAKETLPIILPSHFWNIALTPLNTSLSQYINALASESEEWKKNLHEANLISKQGALVRFIASIECHVPMNNALHEELLKIRSHILCKLNPASPEYRLLHASYHLPLLKCRQEQHLYNFEEKVSHPGAFRIHPLTSLQAFIFSSPGTWRILLDLSSKNSRDKNNGLRKLPLSMVFMILSFHDPLYLLGANDMENILFHVRKSREEGIGFFQKVEPLQKAVGEIQSFFSVGSW